MAPLPEAKGPAPKLSLDSSQIVITGAEFDLVFSRETGKIVRGTFRGREVLQGGPDLNLVGQALGSWSLKRLATSVRASEVVVVSSGSYGPVEVEFHLHIDGQGLISTLYRILSIPPLERKIIEEGYRRDVGGYWEVGISYLLSGSVDRLAWERKGLWSVYPADHIGRPRGTAYRRGRGASQRYGERPAWPWSEDEKDFILFGRDDPGGRGTRDFSSTKENIYWAAALLGHSTLGVEALSDARHSVRLEVVLGQVDPHTAPVRFFINNEYNVPSLAWGNWVKDPIVIKPSSTNRVLVRFCERTTTP